MTARQPVEDPPAEPGAAAMRAVLRAVVEHPGRTMIGLDFDGTLAPIVADPEQAVVHPDAVDALARLGGRIGVIAVITGRPVRTAVRLGGFDQRDGLKSMIILGQYGNERWDARTDTYDVPPEPPEIAAVADEVETIIGDLGLDGVRIEHKGRAIGVHTRAVPDGPAEAFARLRQPMTELADRHGLQLEPGKMVLEIRMPGMDKGVAVRSLVEQTGVDQVIFAGDDLGDLPAFEAVLALRAEGKQGLLVCSASQEEEALSELADVVVDGPEGVAAWLHGLADSLDEAPGGQN